MNVVDYLRALKRRWTVLALATVIALAGGFLSTLIASSPSNGSGSITSFTASATLWNTRGSQTSGLANLNTMAAFVTIGEVPKRVAKELSTSETPAQLASQVQASADSETQLLTIEAAKATAAGAEELANAFAAELIDYVGEQERKLAAAQAKPIENDIEELEREIAELDAQLQVASPEDAAALSNSRDTKVSQIEQQEITLDQLLGPLTQTAGLELISPASATPTSGPGTFQPPRSVAARLLIVGILGLLAGIALVLVLERFDTRIYGKPVAEERFGLPVIAEIPSVRRRQMTKAPLVTVDAPKSPSAGAYRLLAAELGRRTSSVERFGAAEPLSGYEGPKAVLLVTSSAPGEGKTSLVANLAASLAELGKRVIVLSCDFHRPEVHRLLNVPAGPGLAEALADGMGREVLNGHIRKVNLGGRSVDVVTSGEAEETTAELLSSSTMSRAIEEAKSRADIVLLDTPPLLTSSDAVLLFSQVDSILVVARAGQTTAEMALHTSELLSRLNAPAAGIVLNATKGTTLPRYSRKES